MSTSFNHSAKYSTAVSRILSLTEFVDKTRWLLLKVHEKICQISGNSIKICRNKVIFAQPWPMIFTQIYNKSLPHFIFNSFLMFTHYETLLCILCCTSGIYLQFTSMILVQRTRMLPKILIILDCNCQPSTSKRQYKVTKCFIFYCIFTAIIRVNFETLRSLF